MSFFQKWANRLMAWLNGRSGVDQLALAALLASLLFQIIASAAGFIPLYIVSLGLYGWTLFRVFSKQRDRRFEENRKFLAFWSRFQTKSRQFFLRMKLRKQYKYFRCPKCHVLMRTARDSGEKEMHCPKCHSVFKIKS